MRIPALCRDNKILAPSEAAGKEKFKMARKLLDTCGMIAAAGETFPKDHSFQVGVTAQILKPCWLACV
jgi:hypothetical protein